MLFWNSLIMTPVRWGSRKGRDGNGIGQESHIEMYFVFLPFFLVMTPSLFTLRATVFLLYLPLPLVLSHLAS